MEKFTAEIKKVEDNSAYFIEIPFDVEKVFGGKRVKVKVWFGDVLYRGLASKMGMDCYFIGMNKDIREKVGKYPGDLIEVKIEKDEEERIIELPEMFMIKLKENSHAFSFYNSLSFSNKKKYFTFLTSAKKEETRIKRYEKALDMLKNKEKL